MREFPSGPEGKIPSQKAGYMGATFSFMLNEFFPCEVGRTIYEPIFECESGSVVSERCF